MTSESFTANQKVDSFMKGDSVAMDARDAYLIDAGKLRKISCLIKVLEAVDIQVSLDLIQECQQVVGQTKPAEFNLLGCMLARSEGLIPKAVLYLEQMSDKTQLYQGTG